MDLSVPGRPFLTSAAAQEMARGKVDDSTATISADASASDKKNGGGGKGRTKTNAKESSATEGMQLMTFDLFHRKYWGKVLLP